MQLVLFWIFSLLMLLCAMGVVFFRNPVSSAMSLVLSFIALAAVFVTLDAFFIAVVQVLVYAGAVMVLFLFIIMLLDLREEKRRRVRLSAWLGGGLVVGGFISALLKVVLGLPALFVTKPVLSHPLANDIEQVGFNLFRNFNLPFQMIGVLLLVATVGVVLLSKKELK
ncbi:MAG: NADH-quinone oxidoreductase subunit J [bacterium]|jgi:NADH-quinone oxidoreductase subunit J|nr:NADH-quinone oxidoreductase subunit J [Verrucomicrobiota bacterium]NBR49064.1 NADH-quinone oxidoreductase subunit J [bacterium]NBS51116.1 NADH-quinone oxidoreductase subunit J [Spartobacteria bacterium]